jgi:hypothetical protein
MAITGLIQQRGSTVTIRRATKTSQSDGSRNAAWSTVLADTKALIESVTSGLAQRLWGQETEATLRAFMPPDTDITVGDGMQITAGAYAGSNYRVTAAPPRDLNAASRHIEVGLTLTTETFA